MFRRRIFRRRIILSEKLSQAKNDPAKNVPSKKYSGEEFSAQPKKITRRRMFLAKNTQAKNFLPNRKKLLGEEFSGGECS
jgi:ribosomal protein S1